MQLFENKVGRPTNEIKAKRRNFVIVVSMFVIAAITSIFVLTTKISGGKLLGAASGSTTINMQSVTTNGFTVQWKATGSYKAESFTIYNSDSKGTVGKKNQSHNISSNKQNGTWKISNLKPGQYYLVSVKFKPTKVVSKIIRTNLVTTKVDVSNIELTNATINWNSTGTYANNFTLYSSNSSGEAVKKIESHIISNKSTNGSWKVSKLTKGSYYKACVRFATGSTVCKNFATKSNLLSVTNIKSTSAIIIWETSGKINAQSFSVYSLTSNGTVDKLVSNHSIPSKSVAKGSWQISSLKSNTSYQVVVKLSNGSNMSYLFRTAK